VAFTRASSREKERARESDINSAIRFFPHFAKKAVINDNS